MAAVDLAQVQGTDKLVTWRLDRLGRDSAEYIPLLKGLRRLGVDVVSVTQPTESIFMQQVIGIMAEEESRQLSTRVTASKQRRAQEGKWGGLPPFGYGTEKHPTGGSVLVPNALGPLVTKMFERYATGRHSLADLRKFLQDSGYVKTRYGVSAMLRNPAYVGIVRHGAHTSSQFHPQGEVLETKGAHPPLIDRATFDRGTRPAVAQQKPPAGQYPAPEFLKEVKRLNNGYRPLVAAGTLRHHQVRLLRKPMA